MEGLPEGHEPGRTGKGPGLPGELPEQNLGQGAARCSKWHYSNNNRENAADAREAGHQGEVS